MMMKTNAKNNSLTKKVLFSLLAAGMLSGFALSAEADHIELFNGQRNETPVDVSWIFVNRFENNPDPVSLTLNGGKVTGGDGWIDASSGETTVFGQLSGSTGYPHTKSQTGQDLTSCDVAAYAKGIGQLIEATNVEFTGAIAANADNVLEDKANVIINGGRITAGKYYYYDQTTDQLIIEDNATYVTAFNKGKIELNGVDIKSNISASTGGQITVNNSDVNAANKIYAADPNTVISFNFGSTDANENGTMNTTEANKKGCISTTVTNTKGTITVGSQIFADKGAKISINNANINVTKQDGLSKIGTIESTGDGSQIELKNSHIIADNLKASNSGKLTLDKNSSATVDAIAATNIYDSDGGTIEIYGNFKTNNLTAYKKGKIYLQGGADTVYEVDRDVYISDGGKLYIKSGMLKAETADTFKTSGTQYDKIFLEGTGIISTISKNIYTNEASAIQNNPGNLKNNGIVFTDGELILNDAQYTLSYAQAAQAMLSQKGSTKLTMAGYQVDENGNAKYTMSTKDIDKPENRDINFDQLTVIANGNLLVDTTDDNAGHKIDGITVQDTVQNGFGAGFLDLGIEGANSVFITKNRELTLGGSLGGNLITVNGKDVDNIKVFVGLTEASATNLVGTYEHDGYNGILNIGNALATADTKYTLSGEVIVNKDSQLNSKGQTEITKGLTLNEGTVNVNLGSLKTKNLKIIGNSNLLGQVKADTLDITADKTLFIGDATKAGKLTVDKATLNGGLVFLDPVWKDGMTIGDASGFALKDVSSALDGAYVAGRNSKLSFGADLSTAEAKFAKTGYAWGDGEEEISAAAYIAKSIDLDTGSITVDGSLDAAPTAASGGTLILNNKSMLIVDAAQTKTEAAIKNVNTVAIGDSILYIDEAKKGETYHILADTADGWDDEAIDSNNSLLKFEQDTSLADEYAVTASVKSIDEAFGAGQVIASNIYDAALEAQSDGDAAYDFIMAVADSRVNISDAAQVNALNSAAAMGELAGVEHSTYAVSNLLTDAVSDHLSLASDKQHDSDIWAKYIHTKENIAGLSLANFGAAYDAQYNGIVVGADLYKKGKATVGAALTYVDGNINGHTLAARTKNEATYYGASIYGGLQNEDSAVIGDISYLHGKHDITQDNSGYSLTAAAKSDAFSIGVRAEKSVKAGVGKFVPYAGLRYMHLGTGNYTNSIGLSYDGDDMNLWLLPVGVKYSAEVKAGSWTLRPLAEVGYVWNLGDREATQTVSLSGASDGFGYDVADSGSYIGRFGIEAEKANVTYGLGYEYQKGDSVKANRWMANLNWSF